MRFIGSGAIAFFAGYGLVQAGAVNKQMAYDTWVSPIADFFKRYGVKLALVLLLLIGFYRISDIIAGVISNVFYQDLNFTKEQIAEAVKIYGVIFSLVGGFLGGLLAQRMNIILRKCGTSRIGYKFMTRNRHAIKSAIIAGNPKTAVTIFTKTRYYVSTKAFPLVVTCIVRETFANR